MRLAPLAVATLLASTVAHAAPPVYTLDLRPLFPSAPSALAQRRQTYDTLVAAACLQGLANRSGPNLYLYYVTSVVDGSLDTDALWWKRLADPAVGAGILDGRPVVALASVDDALTTFAPLVRGLVVWDEKVPATVNAAFTAAGADDLLAVRWDSDPSSLFQRWKARLPVKVWLVNSDGSSRFLDRQGGASIPDTTRQTSQSAKADVYVWALERYLKAGKLDPTELGWMLDARWIPSPNDYAGNLSATNQWQIANRDWLVARRGLPFDLSPWTDVAPTDDPGQPVGTDPGVLKEMLASARAQAGGQVLSIRGFFAWQFKYTTLEGLPAGHEPVAGEWAGVRLVSPYAASLDADAPGIATMANASFFAHVPLAPVPDPQRRPTAEDLVGNGFLAGLAPNGGFEDGEAGWTMHVTNHVVYADPAGGPPSARTGLRFLECNTNSVGNDLQDNLYRDGAGALPGRTVTLRAFVRAPGAPVTVEAVIWALGGSTEKASTTITPGAQWTEVRATLPITQVGHTATRGQLYLRTNNANLDVEDVAFYAGDAAAQPVVAANYLLWFVGDYDAAAWTYAVTPTTWDKPGRGLVPLAWDFSGHVAARIAPFFRYALATRTPRDFFVGADSGPGYGNPSQMDAAARTIWQNGGARDFRRLDDSITWVLNPLDPLDALHAQAVTPFAGDGLLLMAPAGGVAVPSILDHAPVLALENLAGNTAPQMTASVLAATPQAPSAPTFHSFRVVLLPSTEIVAASHQLALQHGAGRYRIVDPYTFTYLARAWLGGDNRHRASFKNVTVTSPVTVGARPHVTFTLHNDGWETWRAQGANPDHVGFHVAAQPPPVRSLPSDGAAYPTRVPLPTDLPPGGEVSLAVDLPPAPSPGTWTVQADLVEEGITWFETQGDLPIQFTYSSVAAPVDAATPPPDAAPALDASLFVDAANAQDGPFALDTAPLEAAVPLDDAASPLDVAAPFDGPATLDGMSPPSDDAASLPTDLVEIVSDTMAGVDRAAPPLADARPASPGTTVQAGCGCSLGNAPQPTPTATLVLTILLAALLRSRSHRTGTFAAMARRARTRFFTNGGS